MASKTNAPRRQLTAAEYRILAEHADAAEAEQRQQDRTQRMRRLGGVPGRRWATDQHVKAATKHEKKAAAEVTDPLDGESLWQRQRKLLIRDRNRRRRRPWYPAVGSVALGLVGQGATVVFGTAGVPPEVVAGVVAGVPAVVAGAVAGRVEHTYRKNECTAAVAGGPPALWWRRWYPEIALAGAASAAVVYWVAMSGMSWLISLALMVATLLLGSRWWSDPHNRIGPGVAPLEPRRPQPAPVPTAGTEHDPYALAWTNNLQGFGRLTNRTLGDNIVQYDVELPPQRQYDSVMSSVLPIAGALGLDPQQVIPERPGLDASGFRPANRARLTIIERDVTSGVRFWTQPHVHMTQDGTTAVLTNLGRFRDGRGEPQCVMWNSDGMVPTTVYGSTGSGKSALVNSIAIGALSTGLLNSVYVDFKGNSSGMLRSRARITVVGQDSVKEVRQLAQLLREVRIGHTVGDKLFPSQTRPGWFFFLEEIAKGIQGDYQFAKEMENTATTVRSLGVWLVATAHSMNVTDWGSNTARSAFSKQAFAFFMNTKSADQLISGLSFSPSTLPTYDDEVAAIGQENQPVPGFGVGVNTRRANVPAKFDWLPGAGDPVGGGAEPPWRADAAWDAFVNEPGIAADEYAALVDALGEPDDDGRWTLGIGGRHRFPRDEDKPTHVDLGQRQRQVRDGNFEGKRTPSAARPASGGVSEAERSQTTVLQIIEGGTTRTGDIENALRVTMGRATVYRALDALVRDGRIHRLAKGEYAIAGRPSHAEPPSAQGGQRI